MEINEIISSLHPLERKVLPAIEKHTEPPSIIKATNLQEVEVIRALQWLQNKSLIVLEEDIQEIIELGANGVKYKQHGLPERKFISLLAEKEKTLNELESESALSKDEITLSIGTLKKKAAINIKKEASLTFSLNENGKKLLEKKTFEELFLEKQFPVQLNSLKEEERFAYESLKQRKDIVFLKLVKSRKASLTELGKSVIKSGIREDFADKLTPEMLKSGEWKNLNFRRFDVSINVPSLFGGRKQHYRRFLDSVRQKFMSLGFIEMNGPIVETDFWDMDALYMPQFHSARDIHQAYYIKEPEFGEVPEEILNKVKAAHENGGETGSKGWQYSFDSIRTKRNLLRTQGTACSARMLASKDLQIPAKYFGLVRAFRYDVIDATHLPDFNQVEGIVLEEGLNLRHLFGLLQTFAKEFAETDKIRLLPGYFPFTEPSVELFAKHPDLGWIELGGAGIFRPEVTNPLGVKVPVIAWGLGIDRLAMFKMGIKDIRQLFSHDLKVLRSARVV